MREGARRSWVLRYKTRVGETTASGAPKTVELGLGPVDRVSLAEARELRDQHLKAITAGLDPKTEKRRKASAAKNRHTFLEAAEAVIAARRRVWRVSATGREASFDDWSRSLHSDCASLGKLFVDEIDVTHVKSAVAGLWDTGRHATFRRTLQRVELTLEYCLAHGWRTADNPASWRRMQHLFPVPKQNGGTSHASLDWRQTPAIMAALRSSRETMTGLALEMIVLTAARSGEVLGMRWREIDFDNAVWTIPAERMKAGREHTVPLSSAAMTLLKKLAAIPHKGNSFVFPGEDADTPLRNQGVWARTQKLATTTTHGFRSSFRSWASDHAIDPEVAEACLAHARGTAVQRAYDRSDLLDRRRPVLEAWARFLSGEETGKVVPLRKRAGRR
jgi:integrase